MVNIKNKYKGNRKRKLSQKSAEDDSMSKILIADEIVEEHLDECGRKIEVMEVEDDEDQVKDLDFSLLPTRQSHCDQLLIAAKSGNFALIEGPIGCGKTFLAGHAAKLMQLPLRTVQMGDQVDSKSIIGSYHCTEVAGQFQWKPSAFSQWLRESGVVVIEDIDLANPDVVTLLGTINEKRSITYPSGEIVPFHPNAHILATVSGKGKKCAVLEGIPVRVILNPLTDDELKRLAVKAHPRLAPLAKTMVKIFRQVEAVPPAANSRMLTSSDLLRACARVANLTNCTSNMDIFAELIDCWCLHDVPQRARRLCEKVATPLTINEDQIHYQLDLHQPCFTVMDTQAVVGRCTMPRTPSLEHTIGHKLGHTRDVLQLLERIAICVNAKEPVLLVGETGVGKTSVVQSLANVLSRTLTVVNLSPTSDSDELIEGYKPTTVAHIMEPFTKFFSQVLTECFDAKKNKKFLSQLETCLANGRYRDYLTVVEATARKALEAKVEKDTKKARQQRANWAEVLVRGRRIREGLQKGAAPFAITRGAVKQAAEEGHWLLIDEINLAPPECLDAIVHYIGHAPHPNFRMFACMNPATDAGKRRLPASVRTRFTEFFVSETTDPHQLALIISAYLPFMKAPSVQKVVQCYTEAKQMFPGSYSLRTLCRALLFASDNVFGHEGRSLLEALQMAFLTNLDAGDKQKLKAKIISMFPTPTSMEILPPGAAEDFIKVAGYWITRGTVLPEEDPQYVITRTVQENLAEISRIVCSGRFPVLLEGETSAGKTSIVCHLAKITGNAIVRINNHEHTDVQEYMGSYVADSAGRLVFREGALVRAVRDGSWVILDELNLAPTDVIEALNRLLDDNRELFVPELNTAIKAHPNFRLFATQNPAGTYSGRKKLSRALLSRFVVLRFPMLPLDELSDMVCTRCSVHPTAAQKMIAVLSELRLKRSLSGLFSARDGLMTLRDVFRWAKRLSSDSIEDDWLQSLANHGYLLLAGRCRNRKDADTVVEALQRVLRRKIDEKMLFAVDSPYMPRDIETGRIVLTKGMRRMLVMTHQAWLRDEAVLVVGETGGGKTSLAQTLGRGKLLTINCHERTETADLLGRLRPKEKGGFEWSDGIVISAMRAGAPLLVDEISLAEDSVLERLNPLFEENRSLLLSDAGVEVQTVSAVDGYQMIATMNPGGDYGKKELSKALRNRFTEVWSSCDFESDELLRIFDGRLALVPATAQLERPTKAAKNIVHWVASFYDKYMHVFRNAPSVRDMVACADLYAACVANDLPHEVSVAEAIHSTFLDSVSSMPTRVAVDASRITREADNMLSKILECPVDHNASSRSVEVMSDKLKIGLLSVPVGPIKASRPKGFSLKAPTCVSNFYRIARGLLIEKPILLEGAPGCGKSSTVMALAQLTGHPITRLNLSDQTDLSDLFGSDVPVMTDEGSISFRWEDGPVLRAIKRGEWVLLDEMNLASQSVLEGLNACFDHRRVLYIAELNKEFEIPSDSKCRFFACQNPRAQGGNRRALPKSFINRFTNIWVDDLTTDDIFFILRENELAKEISDERLKTMVQINAVLSKDESCAGGPFSFNLRDLLRWIALFNETGNLASAYQILYVSRMRRSEDREKVTEVYKAMFNEPCSVVPAWMSLDNCVVRIGDVELKRLDAEASLPVDRRLLSTQCPLLYKLATCAKMGWLSLLIGPRNCGKRGAVEGLAAVAGAQLEVITLNADTDAQELIGSYEQIIDDSHLNASREILLSKLDGLADPKVIKKIAKAENLLQLEAAAEIALNQITENSEVVEECRAAMELAEKSDMRFAWVDSPFVRAFLEGHWLFIDDVNLCSGAVLDRLNSCLEADGRLVVSERSASFEPLTPHPNFRVFLSMDARNGEISRAMRNRSVEMWIPENERWNLSAGDARAVALSQTAKDVAISDQVARSLCSLTAEQILHFGVLLNEMDVDGACRVFGISADEVDVDMGEEDEEERIPVSCPPVLSVVASSARSDWNIAQWAAASSGGDPFVCLLMTTLSASTELLKSEAYAKIEGAENMLVRLKPILSKVADSAHPVDLRFTGALTTNKKAKKFTMAAFLQFVIEEILAVEPDAQSAEHLSRTLTKFEMTTCEVGFKNMPVLPALIDGILSMLKNGEIKVDCAGEDEKMIVVYGLRLLLFCVATRLPLLARAGPAPIYLAWTDLQRISNVKIPQALEKVFATMNKGWSLDSFESFLKQYLNVYEKSRVADPFDSEEQCQRFSALLEDPVEDTEMSEKRREKRYAEDEEDEEEEDFEREQGRSALELALELVGRFERVDRFLNNLTIDETDTVFQSQKPLVLLSWRNTERERIGRVLSLLNAQYLPEVQISSLARTAAFPVAFTSFWDALGYDQTMSLLKVGDLSKFSVHGLIAQLWRLAPNSRQLQKKIRSELRSLEHGVEGFCQLEVSQTDEEFLENRVRAGLEVMRRACPPADTLDPVVYEEEMDFHLQYKEELLANQLDVLRRFRKLTSGQEGCDDHSAHPVIAVLHEQLIDVRAKIAERKSEQRSQVYRQKASLYPALLSEMRQFVVLSEEVCSKLPSIEDLQATDKDQLEIVYSQLASFATSAQSFITGVFRKYASFVDISVSFVLGVLIVQTGLSEVIDLTCAAVKRKQLMQASALPRKFTLAPSIVGLRSVELEMWSVRDASPMPLRAKAALVGDRERNGIEGQTGLEWTRNQWKKWYEHNVAKAAERDFVYRTKTEEEKDEAEVEAFFDKEELEQRDKEVLPTNDMALLVETTCRITDGSKVQDTEQRLALASAWIRHLLHSLEEYPENAQHATIDADLRLMRSVSEQEERSQVDVYKAVSVVELRRAIGLLSDLVVRTKQVQERWPEVVTLQLILDFVKRFLDAPLSCNQMKMAVHLENIIERCEEWEQLADRENSVRVPLAPLRELLVDWKKMEVRSWSSLLERTQDESEQRARLVAYPLFEALFSDDSKDAAIVPMAIEWMHNGCLVDFSTRIESVRGLGHWAEQLGRKRLGGHLRSAASHFEQFKSLVDKRLQEMRGPVEDELKDYLRIARYNDLNLWNIKNSSQKAHKQLYKMVKKYREHTNEPVAPMLNKLLNVDSLIDKIIAEKTLTDEGVSDRKTKRAFELASAVVDKTKKLCDLTPFDELAEQVQSCDQSLRTRLTYKTLDKDEARLITKEQRDAKEQGKEEAQKENEKLQGMENHHRRKAVAMIIKEGQSLGLNARRAITVNKEKLTENSVTGLGPRRAAVDPEVGPLEREDLVRAAAFGRNIVLQRALTTNDQVGVSTHGHLVGVVDYGMSWQYMMHKKSEKWADNVLVLKQLGKAIATAVQNEKDGFRVDHTAVKTLLPDLKKNAEQLKRITSNMKNRCDLAPEKQPEYDADTASVVHPLSLLYKGHARMELLTQTTTRTDTIAKEVEGVVDELTSLAAGRIFPRAALVSHLERISLDVADLQKDFSELSEWFVDEVAEAKQIMDNIEKLVELPSVETTEFKTSNDVLLLFVQQLYKKAEEMDKEDVLNIKEIDRFNKAAVMIDECSVDKVITRLKRIVRQLASGGVTTSLSEISQLTTLVTDLYHSLVVTSLRSLHSVSTCYHRILSLSEQLFSQGYVNTIPKEEKAEEGEGMDVEGDNCGMGEGQSSANAKDVTEEMEETGQIEGLQDEIPEDHPDGPSMENDKPIDMEDDFPEDLRDIDREEKNEQGDDDKEEESDEEDEPDVDDQMGDVEEPEDEQLDPDLWDDKEKDKQPNEMDQENKAADKETNEMAAKDQDRDADKAPEEAEEKEKEDAKENEEDDVENADEREADDDAEDDSAPPQIDDMQKPEEGDEDGSPEDEVMDMDENNEVDGEDEDAGDEETNEEEQGNEEEGKEEENAEDEVAPVPDDEEPEPTKEDQTDTMEEQGQGGEKKDEEKEGAGGRQAEEEEEKEDADNEGQGTSKQDDKGEASKGADASDDRQKEEKEGEEEQPEEGEQEERQRKLATEDAEMEEADEGDGERDDKGEQMQQAAEEEKQMFGKGSMDEARESKKKERPETEKKKRRDPFKGLLNEGTEDIGADDGELEELPATVHLAPEDLYSLVEDMTKELVYGNQIEEEDKVRENEIKSAEAKPDKTSAEIDAMWQEMSRSVGILSAELAENLRLILEPQRATKLQGDYRTGKRLNMRRLIPYIASEYRKDRIWMRRTKKAQRDYQVLIAVDDSGSMDEFGMGRVTCESVCVVEDALRRVDAGAVQVVSFGADVRVLSAWGEQTQPGPDLLSKLHFQQKSTDLLGLLNFSMKTLNDMRTPLSEQLLIVISDGRGALNQGADKVRAAVHALQGVTVLFVVLDTSKKSVEEMTVASFEGNSVKLTPYLSLFPFPFYAVVKSVAQLPSVLTESIRQWFEMAVQQNM